MVKKKTTSSKKSKKRGERWLAEDVKVHTALPPQVDGQLRCFCKVTISKIVWLTPLSPDLTQVRVKWWGEHGEGSIFKPVDVKKGEKGLSRTTARYPVRSGPRQFAAYLDDMGSMSIEVLSGPMSIPIGQAHVAEIGLLSNKRPINGFFPVFSHEKDKIAEIHVSVMLEPLMASYDSMGSIPTTDVSVETFTTQDSAYPQRVLPTPHYQQPMRPEQDPFISPASHQIDDSRTKVSDCSEDLRLRLRYDSDLRDKNASAIDAGSTVSITANGDVVTTHAADDDALKLQTHRISKPYNSSHHDVVQGEAPSNSVRSSQTHLGGDLLSVLLDKGKKLRDAMAISSLPNSQHLAKLKEIKAEEIQIPADIATSVSTEFSKPMGSWKDIHNERLEPVAMDQDYSGDLSSKAVDLVVGSPVRSNDFKTLQMVNGLSPGTSLSSVDDVLSEPGDPIQEESILRELFYNRSTSEHSDLSDFSMDERSRLNGSMDSLEHPGNARPLSRHSSMSSLNVPFPEPEKKKKKSEKSAKKTRPYDKPWRRKMRRPRSRSRSRSRSKTKSNCASSASEMSDGEMTPRSEISRVSFDMTPSDVEEPVHDTSQSKLVDGLSVERLTLLGRVHVARVSVESLALQKDLDTSRSSRKSDKVKHGRPPRPTSKTKKSSTYFIEYQFPVVATSRDKYSPNAMATEVMRVASKNVKNGVVSFNHRSVFPIMFDGSSIEKWWKSALIFKVFSREAGQKIPSPLGSCGVPLKSILKSESFCVNRDIEVREGSRNTSLSGSFKGNLNGLFGFLKVTVELASDHKEFATALARTKLAEMSGKVKIVPVIATRPPPPAVTQPVAPPTFPRGIEAQSKQFDQLVASNTNGNCVYSDPLSANSNPSRQNTQPVPVNLNIALVSANQNQNALEHPVNQNQNFQSVPANQNQSFQPAAANQNQNFQPPSAVQQFPTSQTNVQAEVLTLHMLMMIPDGRNINVHGVPPLHLVNKTPMMLQRQPQANSMPGANARDVSTRNVYLVCRMFWCNDEIHSTVCWGTSQPEFNMSQVVPVLMTTSLLERMRNNFMVIEVWDKKTSAESDQLVGMVKLSLHQFYMSFKDVKIATALLKSQFPVIGADNFLAITNPFTSFHFGQLRVLLAMGSAEQIASLQRLKLNRDTSSSPERPNNFLERHDMFSNADSNKQQCVDSSVEHVFEVVIEGIRGLKLFENMIWGEADSFVQYHFPTQGKRNGIKNAVPTMKSYRTATTLCIPDSTFHNITRHQIVLPPGTPVQRELLTACANSAGGIGGLPFEVWCRHYHPNVRDQVIAKATLPLAKLCAMVTMQKRGEPATQAFSLPLSQIATENDRDTEVCMKVKDSGLIDITIHYKTNIVHNEPAVQATSTSVSGSHVCISVGVLRASGLKAAAENLARFDVGMQYPAEVGLNAYVSIRLSFLTHEGERHTKTIARNFSPEFSYYMDFPCPLLWTDPQTDGHSLAEILQSAEATFEVWHQIPGTLAGPVGQYVSTGAEDMAGRSLIEKTGDILLGTSTILLAKLLSHRTGIVGWFPLKLAPVGWNVRPSDDSMEEEESGDKGLSRVGGGLELSVRFAHQEDRDKVVHSGRSVGWAPHDMHVEEEEGWNSAEESNDGCQQVTVHLDRVCFPQQNAFRVGQTSLDSTARCYVRYKFYDKTAVISKSRRLRTNDSSYVVTGLKHKHKTVIQTSSPYQWYLREERLEVQVWVSYGSRKEQRSKHRDKLIGSAFIDLDSLCDSQKRQQRISGMYPLFKPGAASLGGGYVRAHISTELLQRHSEQNSDSEVVATSEASKSSFDTDCDPDDSFHHLTGHSNSTSPRKRADLQSQLDPLSCFPVHIHIERAMHLPFVTENNKSGESCPTTYVTFQSAESTSMVYTPVFPSSVSPSWDFEVDTHLSTELLHAESKNLVFKVWHKPTDARKSPDKSSDRVLGFVSVDLSPLTSGLQRMCGWYNIVDFNGQCKGQIKVNIIPQEPISASSSGLPEEQCASLPSRLPSYQTAGSVFPPLLPNIPSLDLHHLDQRLTTHQRAASTESNRHEHLTLATHWQPRFPSLPADDSSSKSYLFSSLRKNLNDLDILTENLKKKLTTDDSLEHETYSGFHTVSASRQHKAVNSGKLSHSHEESARTGGDSGAFSGENSYDKVHESSDAHDQDTSRSAGHDSKSQTLSSRSDRVTDLYREQPLGGQSDRVTDLYREQPLGGHSGRVTDLYREQPLDSQRSDDLSREEKSNVSPDSGYRNGNFSMSTPRESQNNPNVPVLHDFTNTLSTLQDTSGNSTAHDSLKTPRDFTVNHELSQGFVPGQMATSEVRAGVDAELDRQDRGVDRTDNPSHAGWEEEQSVSDDEEKYGSYRRYEHMLDDEDVHGHDVDADDEADDIQMVRPKTLNSVSMMLSSQHDIEEVGDQFDVLASGDHNKPEEFETNVWSRQTQANQSDSEDETRQVKGETRVNNRAPQTMVDSWLSVSDDMVKKSQELEEPRHTVSRQQPGRARHLLSNVELIDTLTSTLSVGNGKSRTNNQRMFDKPHNHCLLSDVDLDSFMSGSNSQQISSDGSRFSRQSSAVSSRKRTDSACDFDEQNELQWNSDCRKNSKVNTEMKYKMDLAIPSDASKQKVDQVLDPLTMVKMSESELLSPTSSGQSGPHLVNFVTESRSRTQSDAHTDRITEDSGVESGTKSSQDDKDISYSSDLARQTATLVPNFFIPSENMQACLRALQVATTMPTSDTGVSSSQLDQRSEKKAWAASELKEKVTMETKAKFAPISAKHRQLPTAEEAKRIAKIFSSKLA